MSWEEVKSSLIASFPPGAEEVWDWDDAPGQDLEATAKVVQDNLIDPIEALAIEVNPATCVRNQSRWERDLAITNPAGSVLARRAVLISRLRELGQVVTRPMVQGVLAPLLDMPDASQIVVIESSRSQLRDSHTYSWSGSLVLSGTPQSFRIRVYDDALVSYPGAQLDLSVTGDLAGLSVTLTAPDGAEATIAAGNVGRGSATGGVVRLYFKSLAGAAVGGVFGGDWTVALTTSGANTATAAELFVEGLTRDSTKHDGLGASIYFWGAMVEESKIGPNADLTAARLALQRIRYACRPCSLLRRSVGTGALAAGHYAAIPGDPNSLPNASIPGTG